MATKEITKENTEIAAEEVIGSDSVLTEEVSALFTHKLTKTIEYEDNKFDEITFDFDSLTGGDSLDVENELSSKGHFIVLKTADSEYLIRMCAKACITKGVDTGFFRIIPVKDYNKIMNSVKRFF